MAVNTSTYGIPYNCKNWLALASVVWGNLDTNEAIKVIGGKGSGLMLVKRLNEYVELPTRGSKWSAGLDLYCPFDVVVPADTQKKIPLGIAIQIPDFHVGLLVPRSSMHKTPLRMANSMGVIDSDYTGEICAVYDNVSCKNYTIKRGERIAQLLIVPILLPEVEETDRLYDTERGSNGFGSTGK